MDTVYKKILTTFLMMLIVSIAMSISAVSRRNVTSDKAINETHHNHTKGVSRIEYGEIEHNVPSWHGSLWLSPATKNIPVESDHRFVGNTIQVAPNKFIAANSAVTLVQNSPLEEKSFNGDTFKHQPVRHVVPSPNQFNAIHGISNRTAQNYDFKYNQGLTSDIALFDHHNLRNNYRHPDVKEFPKLETNPSEYGKDCRLYNWGLHSDTTKAATGDRHYQSFPVELNGKCQPGTVCKLTRPLNEEGAFCSGTTDTGAPILCGPERKLTYLAAPLKYKDCSAHFPAHHVSSFHEKLQSGL